MQDEALPIDYLDASVIVRALLHDEAGSAEAADVPVRGKRCVTSQISVVEISAALTAAHRAGRLSDGALARLLPTASNLAGGNVALLALDPDPTLARARELVIDHRLRALDAIHVAVADLDGRRLAAPDLELVFHTRDADQAAAARALGLRGTVKSW